MPEAFTANVLRNRPVREWAAVIVAGFAIFPETLLVLFAGENFGKLVLQIADV
jgi:NADPH-dependent curcumin reductase CurA